ncbi:hypothetical protein MNBD_GAMMA21-2743 [hydrothermal vent metagenome]|uniref:Peptidase C14 caspase domain-containing protein n=1 Tax=hydrothermal vent metagenome TaxID=652676 RepID=A0A3B1A5L2_9ZZZZ
MMLNSLFTYESRQHTYRMVVLLMIGLFGLTSNVLAESRGLTMEPLEKTAKHVMKHGTYRALIIGNKDYENGKGRWSDLKTTLTDANAIKTVLQNNYGFTDVQLLENATRRDVLVALKKLSKRVLSNDNVLVYYAGHGYMDTETNQGYWVPVDAKGVDQTTFLRNSTIRDEMTLIASRARHTLLISDSCFSGTLLRSGSRGIAPVENAELYYQKVANKKSVQILSAGGIEYVDDDYNTSGHSPFTYFLVNELKTNNSPMLTLSELSTNVKKAVANNVEQVPESGVLQGAGDELGEFIFIRVNVSVEGIPKEKVKVILNVESTNVDSQKIPANKKEEPATGERMVAPIPTL